MKKNTGALALPPHPMHADRTVHRIASGITFLLKNIASLGSLNK